MAYAFLGLVVGAFALALSSTNGYCQAPVEVSAAALLELVRGNKLAISYYGDPGETAAMYWDFKADGSICGRIIGSKPNDNCAEMGKWNIEGTLLCWELPSIGKSLSFNTACSTLFQVKPNRYELRNRKTPELKFATLMVVR